MAYTKRYNDGSSIVSRLINRSKLLLVSQLKRFLNRRLVWSKDSSLFSRESKVSCFDSRAWRPFVTANGNGYIRLVENGEQ